MKNLITAIAITMMSTAAMAAEFESDPFFVPDTPEVREALTEVGPSAVILIKSKGWRCDTISGMGITDDGKSVVTVCNKNRYTYILRDVGGNWSVSAL